MDNPQKLKTQSTQDEDKQNKDSTELKNNSTVFEELEVSLVDLTVANAVLLATRSGASKTDIGDRQIHN